MNPARTRSTAQWAALLLAALVSLAAASPGVARPVATAAKTCSPPRYPGQGYFTSLQVRGVTCRFGRKLTLAHYRCRTKHGIRGKCSGVLRFRCSEKRNAISTEFLSRVTCTRGSRRVVYTYEQRT